MTLLLNLWLKCGPILHINKGLSILNQSTFVNSHSNGLNIKPYEVAKTAMEEKTDNENNKCFTFNDLARYHSKSL